MEFLIHSDGTAELYHHGVKGQKWGVRRYQNPDGTLTDAGKKRQAKIEKSDQKYRERQTVKTARYYDNSRRYGTLFLRKVEGIKSLEKKLNSRSNFYDKDVIRGQIATKKAYKELELKKVSELTHEQINKERVEVGKAFAKDALISIGASAVLLPTTGFVYGQVSDPQSVRSRVRRESLYD